MADFARAERLCQLRNAKHLSQEALAHEIGVSVKSIRAWEKGGGIKWKNAKALGIFYGEDPESLVLRELPEVDDGGGEVLSQLDRIEARVNAIDATVTELDEQMRLLRAETAARDAEVLKRLDEGLPPIQDSQGPPPP